ncbi:MAG: TAT-variant-translocated molybdopterin oxidoreductase [Ignavibacteria bacterium]|nr:TAT-variant-translocated molybdopterin oxidoreductase [Ignavibacteria bacterium]
MNGSDDSTKHLSSPRTAPHWRSIDDLERTPGYADRIAAEFPEGAMEPGRGIDRRGFLGLMGASLALAGTAGCRRPEEHIVPYVSKPEEITLGIAQRYATTMPRGTENLRLLAHSHEGRPTHIEGNALDGATGGAVDPWASASLLGLYDPDRSRTPLSRGVASSSAAFAGEWAGLHAAALAKQGEGLAVLVEPFASPTLFRLATEFRAAFPKALWAVYDPVSDENIQRGIAQVTGRRLMPVYDFSKADVILSLDADFLGTETRHIENARAFTDRRRIRDGKDTMNRLFLVEPTLSQTATMADARYVVPAGAIGVFAAHVAAALGLQGLAPAALPASVRPDAPRAIAAALSAARGRALVLAGRRQPPEVHALVAAMNDVLGAQGATVSYIEIPKSESSDTASLKALVDAMNAGKVQTLVMLGGNPAYHAPADLGFAQALPGVRTAIHASPHADETSALCAWHIPLHHYLESWGDAVGFDGAPGVIQPLIAPLVDGRSMTEMLALLVTGKDVKGYDAVVATWKTLLPAADFDKDFRTVLHDGLLRVPAPAADIVPVNTGAVAVSMSAALKAAAPGKDALEVVFQLSPCVHDGRYANNGWLQEFPDPVTKLTWDNAAVMSRATADAFGFKNHELIRLSLRGRDIGLPVWIMPGQADYCVTVALGYGRAHGRVAGGVGASAYKLRGSGDADFEGGATLARIRGEHRLACVQDHHGLDAEQMAREGVAERLPMIVREGTLEEYRAHPEFAKERVEEPPLRSMWDDITYKTGHQWGMTIDLNACTGCGACTIACQSENNIPIVGREQVLNGREMHWIRIDRYFSGTVENPTVLAQPVGCQHCEMAPCEQVCPVAATTHDEEGLNVMTYNRCVGTRYCSNNCPYKARRFNFFNYTKDMPETVQMAQNPDVTVRFRGVMEKCTYCTQRINLARIAAKREGRPLKDGDIVAACESACPTQAIVFGDINDPASRVSKMKALDRDYALLGELNVRPRTTYLAKLRNPGTDMKSTNLP